MYEAVHATPDGKSTVARYAATAASDGYDGVVVRNRHDARVEIDATALREEYGLDVVEGVEIDASDPSRAGGSIGNFRSEYTILLVRGGTPTLNRFAAEEPKVDVLADPMANDGDINHVITKAAVENSVRLEFNFADILRAEGGPRVQALRGLRKLRELVEHYDAPYVVSADPGSHLQLRAPRELLAIGEQIGFSQDQIETGLREWGRLAERNRERQSESYVAPGVRTGRYENGASTEEDREDAE